MTNKVHNYYRKENDTMDNSYAIMMIHELKRISRALEKIAAKE